MGALEIANFIREDLVLEIHAGDRDGALGALMGAVESAHLLDDATLFYEKILEREKQSSTAIGLGIAIPHARFESLKEMFIVVGRSTNGIDFNAPDGATVHLICMIGATSDHAQYLKLVARISWLVRNDELRDQLFQAPSIEDVYALLSRY